MHAEPSAAHMPPRHVMLGPQTPEQHSGLPMQGMFAGWHMERPHVNMFGSHTMAQQSVSMKHGWPSGVHADEKHTNVCGSHWPLQQSASVLQLPPSGLHCVASQVPLDAQIPEQHSIASLQTIPFWRHMTHTSSGLHTLEQHVESCMQGSPRAAQVVLPHAPPLHAAEQHWVAVEQALPS
jgi:hypothetical protein